MRSCLTTHNTLHRWRLYTSQRWPLPADSESEAAQGEQLSQYLGRGTTDATVTFVDYEE